MAKFKVGDKARVARGLWTNPAGNHWIGREVLIDAVYLDKPQWPPVVYLAHVIGCSSQDGHFLPEELEPLIDPRADAFLERIKKLKPYDEPKVVTTEHGTALFPK